MMTCSSIPLKLPERIQSTQSHSHTLSRTSRITCTAGTTCPVAPCHAWPCISLHWGQCLCGRWHITSINAFICAQSLKHLYVCHTVTISRTRCATLFHLSGRLPLLPLLVNGIVVTSTPSRVHLHVLGPLMPSHVIVLLLLLLAKGVPLHGGEEGEEGVRGGGRGGRCTRGVRWARGGG